MTAVVTVRRKGGPCKDVKADEKHKGYSKDMKECERHGKDTKQDDMHVIMKQNDAHVIA